MKERKHAARVAARTARTGLSDEHRLHSADSVAARALTVPAVAAARTVLAYAATPEELDPSALVAALRALGARIAFPRVTGPGALALHWVGDDATLVPGHCGIAEPSADSPEAAPGDLDLVLVPGTAFDEQCERLGMGGGFYDRLTPGLHAHAVTLGLAFDEQIVERVPTETHDVPLDFVITPTRTLQRLT